MGGRSTGLFVALVLAGTAILVGLGFWQWQRRAEKAAFLAALQAAATAEPKRLAEAGPWDRVRLSGRYVLDRAVFVRTSRAAPKPGERDAKGRVPVSGFGVHVVSPFEDEDCSVSPCRRRIVLVSRGFLPTPPDGRVPPVETPAGQVTLTGVMRPSEEAGLLPPANDPARGVFFFRTVAEMLPALQPVTADRAAIVADAFVDREAAPGETMPPFGLDIAALVRAIPNNHLQYAITWWSLAATNLVVAGFFLASRRKKAEPSR